MQCIVLATIVCLMVGDMEGASNDQKNDSQGPSSQRISCSAAGYPGIPGLHGVSGKDGRDGRDGRDGLLGKQGPRGSEGTQGKRGSSGPPGKSGKSGPMGPPGEKGDTGVKGDNGVKGDSGKPGITGLFSHSNWKECSWDALNDDKDNGLLKECVFQKKSAESILHVYWNGNLRIYNCVSCCKRWFFTFDSYECSSPRAIDGIAYIGQPGGQDLHRVRHIEGHCHGIGKGQVRVGFNVGNCATSKAGDAHAGWQSTSRLFVEEVARPQQ